MKVQFSIDECHRMYEEVMDQLLALNLDKHDKATLRRWRSDDMSPGSPLMQVLAEKMNAEIQQSHDRSEVSPIKKPDWVR